MRTKYDVDEGSQMPKTNEPAVAFGADAECIQMTFKVPHSLDEETFKLQMSLYASQLIRAASEEGNSHMISNDYLRQRLMDAAQDAKEGRIMSCKDVHDALESKFPWLCE